MSEKQQVFKLNGLLDLGGVVANNGWTLERRVRQAALIHSWRPWERSSGPKSASGKAIAAHNVILGQERRLRELEQAKAELSAAMAKVAKLARGRRERLEALPVFRNN